MNIKNLNGFDHYIAIDWSLKVMALARLPKISEKLEEWVLPTDLKELKFYLKRLKGTKILTVEESTGSQWLYTELRECVDELIICDPYRNHLLKEGPKTDKIDSRKLVFLLRAGLLKPVYHSGDDFIYLRTLVSGYQDVVKAGVRLKNQRSALFRLNGYSKKQDTLIRPEDQFVLTGMTSGIEDYETEKKRYEKEFHRLTKKHSILRHLKTLPGIGEIQAMKIAARVVDPFRFKSEGQFWSYCGLMKLKRISAGKVYGTKNPRFCRQLKDVFKMATQSVLQERVNNPLKDYYHFLLTKKNYAPHQARHAVSRRIATLALGIFKTKKEFNIEKEKKCNTIKVA